LWWAETNELISPGDKPALDRLSFSIAPGQKVCICGRTGSGKSTIVSALLRLVSIQSGSVSINGINIASVGPDDLRQVITTIPHSPFFLPGNVRANLNPSVDASDVVLIETLQKARLWDIFSAAGGLDADMTSVNLSHGQGQLFCLARAILKRSQILIVDEIASGVDRDTEALMERLIAENFNGCTVIAIAHRLQTVSGADFVMVLSNGKIVEAGEARVLLANQGEFWALQST
jgi:ATP-binding cassette subfamily C (CFTR/MRP) protein 1